MKKSLTINATRGGKKVSKSLGFVNPDVANSLVGGFAQMVNALSNDTYVNSQVVKTMDTTEEDSSGSSTPAAAGLLDPNLRYYAPASDPTEEQEEEALTWEGDGICYKYSDLNDEPETIEKGVETAKDPNTLYVLESDGTYAKDWLSVNDE